MASWLQAQLKAAEHLLDAVDRTVSQTVVTLNPNGAEDAESGPSHGNEESALPSYQAHPEPDDNIPRHVQLPKHVLNPLGTHAPPLESVGHGENQEAPPLPQSVLIPPDSSSGSIPPAASAFVPTKVSSNNPAPVKNSSINPAIVKSAPSRPAVVAPVPSSDGAEGSREQQLSRLCDQLKKRLEVVKAENEQLEEMLKKAEQRADKAARANQSWQKQAQQLQDAKQQIESALHSQLVAQQAATTEALAKLEAAETQVLKLEAHIAALEESHKQILESKGNFEGGMLEALKAQLGNTELRLEQERRAHQATKVSAVNRERDLEQKVSQHADALSELQRALDESIKKCGELEDSLALAQAAHMEQQQQQQADQGVAHALSTSSSRAMLEPSASELEAESLRIQLDQQKQITQQAQQAKLNAEALAATYQEELQQLKDAFKNRDTAQLEQQLKEVSEMVYIKQTQLERLASDKAAQQLKLEREVAMFKDEAMKLRQQVRRSDESRGGYTAVDLIPMDALGETYQRLASNNKVGSAVRTMARFMDATAATASMILRQYPLGRLLVFFYIILIHLYLYFLTGRLQHQAVTLEAPGAMSAMTTNLPSL